MRELSQKLMSLRFLRNETSRRPSVIFGSDENLAHVIEASRPRVRVGMWPWISSEEPEVAMGLATVLGLLLENWSDLYIYRLFVRLETPYHTDYQWGMPDSQFSVDDWQPEGLDENLAIWGTLTRDQNGYALNLEIENDLTEAEEPEVIVKHAASLVDLVNLLPGLAQEIAHAAELKDPTPFSISYDHITASEGALRDLLKQAFYWERTLLMSLWGSTWNKDNVLEALDALLTAPKDTDAAFAAWVAGQCAARAMLPGFYPIGETLVPLAPRIVEAFESSPTLAVILAPALYGVGYTQEAYELLENNQERHPEMVKGWLLLGDLYARARRMGDALDTYQQALESGIESPNVYMRYGDLMVVLNYENWQVDDFVLIDPEEVWEERLLAEAAASYRKALEMKPEHTEALYQLLTQEIEIDGTPPWGQFQQLVDQDHEGEYVRRISEILYNADDLSEPLQILRTAIQKAPDRVDLRLSLAVLLTLNEETDAALSELESIIATKPDLSVLADAEVLMLYADDPEFEGRFGEMVDVVNAGNGLSTSDVEDLEEKLDTAPHYADLYIVLSKAYLAWDEPATALETLLDGQKHLPDDPDILELLARVLWQTDERAVAYEYVRKGLALHPSNVPLLALMGRFLFDDDKDAESKGYLIRAEAIAPRHPALLEIKRYISTQMSE